MSDNSLEPAIDSTFDDGASSTQQNDLDSIESIGHSTCSSLVISDGISQGGQSFVTGGSVHVNSSSSGGSDITASTIVVGNLSSTGSISDGESKSGTTINTTVTIGGCSARGTLLPWGAHKERTPHPAGPCVNNDMDIRPGEFVMRTLFADFTVQAAKKIEGVMTEPPEKPISKLLQRGEDLQFDQLLSAFGSVAEHCLPSLLRALFSWYERQMSDATATEQKKVDQRGKSIMYIVSGSAPETVERSEADIQQEKRDLAVEFIFCLCLIEVLRQLHFHPGHEDLVMYIENLAFRHFKYRDGIQSGPNAGNIHIIADLYAEVIGVLAQSRFMSVRKRFMAELKELRAKEPSPQTTQSVISLLMGMKFFRVKMVPIEEFEASFQFMQEAAQYFLEVKEKDIKHALAGLFVEILVPVAATVKNEVNVPCLKNFVEMLYSQTLDASTKSKHRLALFPLVTCLLCVSQKTFFLQNWHYFLAMCLSHLKNRDPKMSRVALESLYRLLWVYMIRIKCESNSATQSRLQSIVNSLFPKGSKAVVPRDTPLNIFVKIIQFIAQERLDFAMREIVFDLLSVGRPIKIILTPERMSIGLRAFLVVADSLQQKEGEPPMPRTVGVLPSGNTLRVRKTFLNKMLTEDTARSIGISSYFPHVRRVFVDILRALDVHYGRPLMMTSTQNVNKEPDEMITGERKPRIDLFRTCVAAVPRLIPDGMTGGELVDLLARLTVHMDEELRALAYQSLQTLVMDFPDWRQDVLWGFTQFLVRDVQDTFPQLVDNGLRMLLQLLNSWKNALGNTNNSSRIGKDNETVRTAPILGVSKKNDHKPEPVPSVLHLVEAYALVMLCNYRLSSRRLAVHILKDTKLLLKQLNCTEDQAVIDVIDKCCPQVMEKCISHLPPAEKQAALSVSNNVDLQWIADRNACVWTAGRLEDATVKTNANFNLNVADPWNMCLFGFLERGRILTQCPTVVVHSWGIVFTRVNALFSVIDPTPVNDNRASLLRSSATVRKPVNEREMYIHIWKNYVTFAFRVVPPIPSPVIRCASPDLSLSMAAEEVSDTGSLSQSLENLAQTQGFVTTGRFTLPLSAIRKQHKRTSSSPDSLTAERGGDSKTPSGNVSPAALYKLIVPLLRCETSDVRDTTVQALGKVNPDALKDLMDELVVYIREAVDRKQENVRRRRRRDALRLQLVRVLELIAEYGTFGVSQCVLDRDTQSLHQTFVEYMDGARLYLESEPDKSSFAVREITLHFCNFVRKMIKSFSLETCQTLLKRDLRRNLFNLFSTWSGQYARPLKTSVSSGNVSGSESLETDSSGTGTRLELQMAALQAMSALLCCGPCFDSQSLAEDGLLYQWLDMLLASEDEKVVLLARETVILLLECNPDIGPLLDWVVDRCYTGTAAVADGCFLALATIFSAREYPCDHYTAVINVTLMSTGCPRPNVRDTALQLLQLLDKRFFGTVPPLPATEEEVGKLSPTFSIDDANKIWCELSNALNACGDGAVREIDGWKKTFSEWKFQIRKKFRDGKELSKIETELLHATGIVAVQGISGVAEIGVPVTIQEVHDVVFEILDEDRVETETTLPLEKGIAAVRTEPSTAHQCEEAGSSKQQDEDFWEDDERKKVSPKKSKKDNIKIRSSKTTKEQYELFLNYKSLQLLDDDDLYNKLNKCGGPSRTKAEWKQVFQEWTSNVKRKARQIYVHQMETGGGFPTDKHLTELEERLLQLIGKLVVTGINVRELGLTKCETVEKCTKKMPRITYNMNIRKTHQQQSRGRGTLDALLSTTYCRSQMYLSRQLAQLHPELTMPMFSEITHRFQTARPEVRQLLLQYLLPWLHNMELVDPNVPPANPLSYYQYYTNDMGHSGSRREGWGSAEATEMVLNNVFYITAKFADEHPKEMEEVWSTLCSCWPNNLKVIIRYLIIVSGMAPCELLPYAKRVVLYLARARPDRLLDEMMTELQTVETLNCLIERTETPPFYRLTSMRKASSHSDGGAGGVAGQSDPTSRSELGVEKGTIHTKRHSGEDPIKSGSTKSDTSIRMHSGFTSPRNDKSRSISGPVLLSEDTSTPTTDIELQAPDVDLYNGLQVVNGSDRINMSVPQPHPLPMPEYGGYFAPLTEYLPDSSQPISSFHRCNVAVMLLTDVVIDGVDLDWSMHVPLMLHILMLGMDHTRPLVHEHCKQLLLNLLVVLAEHCDHLTVAHILLNSKTERLGLGLTTPQLPILSHIFTESDPVFDSYLQGPISCNAIVSLPATSTCSTIVAATSSTTSSNELAIEPNVPPVIVTPEDSTGLSGPEPGPNMPIADVIKSLIDFLAKRQNTSLWNYEDITAKVWSVRSAEHIDTFLQHVLRVFRDSLPHAHINERWAQTALQLGLSCSSRHYAGRSLQIFRSLRVPITGRMLSDILSRLVETVAEQGEDMQGYVTELLLTLEAAVDSLESDFRPLDFMKEIFKSTPNLNNKDMVVIGGKRSPGGECVYPNAVGSHVLNQTGHTRSTSYSVSYCLRKGSASPASDGKDLRCRGSNEIETRNMNSLSRSRSAQSLKLLGDSASQDDKMTILAQLFWLSVSLLESDYEHEFLLALRLLGRVLHRLPLDRPDARDKVEKLQSQLRWSSFPGVHALLLKGCTHPNICENVVTLLSQFTPLLDLIVVDPTQSLAFPMNVVSLLPYMLHNYEDANELCIRSAENIAQVSAEKSKKLENLGTVMTLYSRRNFSKESFQWTKCVVKYLYDTYAHLSLNMLAFLVEMLEKGPPSMQLPVLNIIHCMLHYIDLAAASSQPINADLLRVIAKYLEGAHWKEALKILKLVVTRSSTLVAPPIQNQSHWESSIISTAPHPSFAESEIFAKKELPGRTMEFTFDLSQTPVIGRRFLVKDDRGLTPVPVASPRRSCSLSPADAAPTAGWKRPWMSQGRVRECLVNLLTTCGQRVGLPKSPSVIFSQSSDLMERQSSMASSTEEMSASGGNDLSGGSGARGIDAAAAAADQFGVFRDFDFLEYESESVEGESTDNFNWGVRRRPLSDGEQDLPSVRTHEESISEKTPVLTKRKRNAPDESSDDEIGSESPLDEMTAAPEFEASCSTGQDNSSVVYPPSSLSLRSEGERPHRDRRDSSTRSDTSGSSAGDLGDVTPCNTSPNISSLLTTFRPIVRNDTEEAWRQHLQSGFSQASTHGNALQLFQHLHAIVKDIGGKTVSMTRDSCHLLTQCAGNVSLVSQLSSRLSGTADLLYSRTVQPTHVICFPSTAISGARITDIMRYGVLEMQEHLETFFDRKDHTTECIDAVKTALKLQLLGESQSDIISEELLLDLGRALYKLHFQFLLFIEAANKMTSALNIALKTSQLNDITKDISTIKTSLQRASLDEIAPTPSLSLGTGDDLEGGLYDLLQTEKWSTALSYVKHNRGCWGSENISGYGDDDVLTALNVFSKKLIQDKSDSYIMTHCESDLADVYAKLFQVSASVADLEHSMKERDQHSSEISNVNQNKD